MPASPATPDPEPLVIPTRSQLIAIAREEAVTAGIPARLGEACGVAEGGLNPLAARCAWPRPPYTNETQYCLNLMAEIERVGIDTVSAAWDGSGVEKTGRQAWDELMARCWADVSFGPMQETAQHYGDHSASYENVSAFRNWTLTDPRGSIRWAMQYLASKYHPEEDDAEWKALNRYNWPAGNGAPFGSNGENYRRALNSVPA